MATFIAIKNAKQTRGAMAGAMGYVAKDEKTLWRGISLVAGHNCVPQSSYIEFLTTKKRFHKMEGRQFYHFVQSFAEGDRLNPTAGKRHRSGAWQKKSSPTSKF